MPIRKQIIEEVKQAGKQMLAVTKYFDTFDTLKYANILEENNDIILGFGENRIEHAIKKGIPREKLHFIGNIQSQRIRDIILHCGTIHSIGSEKHFQKSKKIIEELGLYTEVFLQIGLDIEKQGGFSTTELSGILEKHKDSNVFKIVGISGMGVGIFTREEKVAEFQKLLDIRDKYLPDGKISAGTSRDYQIALELGIDIVRIGKKLFS